jgi:hypothetical protein
MRAPRGRCKTPGRASKCQGTWPGDFSAMTGCCSLRLLGDGKHVTERDRTIMGACTLSGAAWRRRERQARQHRALRG